MVLALLSIFLGFLGSIYLNYLQSDLTNNYKKQLNNYIICNMMISNILETKQNDSFGNMDEISSDEYDSDRCSTYRPKPDLTIIYWQLIVIFGSSFLGFIWICTDNTWINWKRLIKKFANMEYYRKRWKSVQNKRILSAPVDDIESGDNNNGNSKRRKVANPNETHTANTTETVTFRNLDPVEMDLTSVGSQSLINSIKDRFNKMLTRGSDNRRRGSLSSVLTFAGSTTNAGQSFSDISITSCSQLHAHQCMEMTNMVGVKHVQRRKGSRKTIRNLNRRESESSISNAFISATFPGKFETKSTSTADLAPLFLHVHDPLKNLMLPQANGNTAYQMPSNMITPFMTPPAMRFPQPRSSVTQQQQQYSFGHNMAFMNNGTLRPPRLPEFNLVQRPRFPSELKQKSYAFTHGMDDQSGKLEKPFEEKRRPGSSLGNIVANSMANIHQNELPQNFKLNSLSSNQAAMSSESAAMMSALPNAFLNCQMQYQMMPPQWYNFNGFARPPFSSLISSPIRYPLMSIGYNTVLADQYHLEIQKQNLTNQEMEQLLKEREELAYLITATRADSSSDNTRGFLAKNIIISDSEYSGFSDSSRISHYPEIAVINESRIKVEERIKKVEDEQNNKDVEKDKNIVKKQEKKSKQTKKKKVR